MRLLRPYEDLSHDEFRSPNELRREAARDASGWWLVVIFGSVATAVLLGWVAGVIDLWRAFYRGWFAS